MPDPTIRWEWQRTPATSGDRIAAGLAVLGGPLGILGLATGPSGPGFHLTTELNLHTGAVTVSPEVPSWVGGRAHTLLVRTAQRTQPAVEAALNEVYRTGVIPESLPDNYRAIAQQLVDIRRAEERPTDPNLPPGQQPKPPRPRIIDGGPKPFEPVTVDQVPVEVLPTVSDYWPANLSGVPTVLPILPSGIAAAFGQQTPAAQVSMTTGGASRAASPGRRRRTKKRTRTAGAARKRRSGGKFVKGSAAAKRHMAKLRRMRKR